MPKLIAQGADPRHRWRRSLIARVPVILGRAANRWNVPWDPAISRQHAKLVWLEDGLRVTRLESASNPIFFRGKEVDTCLIRPGEHFVIGGTTFTLTDESIEVSLDSPTPVSEHAFSPAYLQNLQYRNADQRIEMLSQLPEVIQGASSDDELFVRLISLLLAGIPRATSAAIVALDHRDSPADQQESRTGEDVRVLQWDRRQESAPAFAPSARLIRSAIDSGKSIVAIWNRNEGAPQTAFTQREDVDWAFCTPIEGEACRGWGIYVVGRFQVGTDPGTERVGPEELQDDLKFAELAATTLRNLREVRVLEHSQAALRPFFSPVVLEALAGQNPDEVLQPRETEVSVLFCDLRGFSRKSERDADDLLGLLNRVSRALGGMTHCILEQGGVVGDFHGDAAMGFWGWPLESPTTVEQACRAALGIRATFAAAAQQENHPLTAFRVGIGLATGRAVAGKIGTVDQVKVTVFGPVVNLASRLETLTKVLRAPLLIDEETARQVRARVSPEIARTRRVARVRPYGLETSVEVSELLPPADEFPQLSNDDIQSYERALDALLAGDWESSFQWLHKVPAEDRVKDFLTVFIAQHNRTPPDDWDGVISIPTK
jgi:adenylate cyclase